MKIFKSNKVSTNQTTELMELDISLDYEEYKLSVLEILDITVRG